MPNTGRLQHHTGGVTEFAILVAQGNDGIESGDPGHVQDVTTKQPDEANASEKETTATEPEVLLNMCVGLEDKDLEVPEEVERDVGTSVPLQWR
ncbi:hypothetical protein PC129_g18309 [Phytophthora cactorum]|uniref:Uncharacterized protein n=1 Tax=Phytophthora cactorum TaxID=29920 RepID=A0A329RTB5_9STRA|nr:hypothetical protein Pcac1_g15688 [Phytophthora cactorum]KAG2802435.1 hypothetical protein PC112_g19630 [Phytophthora cactorum]KAG2803183.1 hypothetical protein PC111_g18790 [Phytophthora cactorum]KAG2839297.1 hypothetical protein PC113_g19504 [Phytophthora cactorum]KAG2881861.1 hypothetical protein PC114_g21348 [Phytophthora cactorum]